MKRILVLVLFSLVYTTANSTHAGDVLSDLGLSSQKNAEPPNPEKVFVLSVSPLDAGTFRLHASIGDCCYLYREKTKIELVSTNGASVPTNTRLGTFTLPPGQAKVDEVFGKTEIYHNGFDVKVPVEGAAAGLALKVTYQGCSEKGVAICFAPITKILPLTGAKSGANKT